MRDGDGFGVIIIDACLLVYSGSFQKCLEFLKDNKQLAYSQGVAVVSRHVAEMVLKDSEGDRVSLPS